MRYLLQRTVLILAAIAFLCFPSSALAAGSTAVTSATATYNNKNLTGEDFNHANLPEVQFVKTKLESANFSNANLRGAVFNNCQLKGANLHGADFTNGLAYVTDFSDTDMTDGIFAEAIMMYSNFKNANITGADFTFATLNKEQVLQLCESASGVNSITGVNTRDSLGCF